MSSKPIRMCRTLSKCPRKRRTPHTLKHLLQTEGSRDQVRRSSFFHTLVRDGLMPSKVHPNSLVYFKVGFRNLRYEYCYGIVHNFVESEYLKTILSLLVCSFVWFLFNYKDKYLKIYINFKYCHKIVSVSL